MPGTGAGEKDSGLLFGGRLWKRKKGVSAGSTMFTDGRDVVTVTAASGLNQAMFSQFSLVHCETIYR